MEYESILHGETFAYDFESICARNTVIFCLISLRIHIPFWVQFSILQFDVQFRHAAVRGVLAITTGPSNSAIFLKSMLLRSYDRFHYAGFISILFSLKFPHDLINTARALLMVDEWHI